MKFQFVTLYNFDFVSVYFSALRNMDLDSKTKQRAKQIKSRKFNGSTKGNTFKIIFR